jgi:NADH:ubiquinone oxidoreductase subunit B-like Fe-S oxidoreductase
MGNCNGCLFSSGGMFRIYSVVQGVDQFLPVDVYFSVVSSTPRKFNMALMQSNKIGKQRPDNSNLAKTFHEHLSKKDGILHLAFDPTRKEVITGKN